MDVSKFNDAYFAKIKAKKAKTADGAPPPPPVFLPMSSSHPILSYLSHPPFLPQAKPCPDPSSSSAPILRIKSICIVPNCNRNALVESAAAGSPSRVRVGANR